jgi:hypothetical protein
MPLLMTLGTAWENPIFFHSLPILVLPFQA